MALHVIELYILPMAPHCGNETIQNKLFFSNTLPIGRWDAIGPRNRIHRM